MVRPSACGRTADSRVHGRGYGVIKREDFIFALGYSGNTAIVDARQKRRYAGLATMELAEKGLFRAALCSAVYNDSAEEMGLVLEAYNARGEHPVDSVEHLQRLFGVFEVPDTIGRTKVL